jgi:hypothetical protein
MIERYIECLRIEDPGSEELASTRERLRHLFQRGATRRMTQLGLFLGSVLADIALAEDDALVYASSYGEARALEDYLGSFPSASPTLFQTSIHPSAVQQVLISRQQPVRNFFPVAGLSHAAAHAASIALMWAAPRAILCGGEERGSWLSECGAASGAAFAFALALSENPEGALATLSLEFNDHPDGGLTLAEWFQALRNRNPLCRQAAPGLSLRLAWL